MVKTFSCPFPMQDKTDGGSSCSAHLQDLTHLLNCPTFEPLWHAIFGTTSSILDLWSRPWGMAQLLGLRGVPPHHHSSEGVG